MVYDIITVGGGAAGLTAAIYARRADKSVLVLEKETFGGQITFSPKVENIPGFTALSGNEFAEKLVDQAIYQGAEFDSGKVLSVSGDKIKTVKTENAEYSAKAVIIATGAKHRMLGLENEEKYVGNGISFCAVCDGAFYKDLTVAVIGGGNSALQEALLLADLAKKVYVVQNLAFLTGEEALQNRLKEKSNVEIICSTVVKSLSGDTELDGITVENTETKTETKLSIDGMFVAIGLVPQNDSFRNIIRLDERGYADYNDSCVTHTDGIFVAGDCRAKKIRQVTTACSDGAVSALAACEYIDNNF